MQQIDRLNLPGRNVQDLARADRPAASTAAPRRARAGRGLFGAIGRTIDRLAAAAAHWRARRMAVADLNALPDWTLTDIGLARSDIPRIADAIAERARGAARDGRASKITLQSLVQDNPLTGHVRVVSGGTPGLAGCG